jgi:membrane-associated protease RseP (regulator of RpoE activity)
MQQLSPLELSERFQAAVADVLAVQDVTLGQGPGYTVRLRGHLRVDSMTAYDRVAPRFRALGHTALFRQDKDLDVILAMPGMLSPTGSRLWLAMAMFLATLASTLFVGGWREIPAGSDFGWLLRHPLAGLPFAASLLGILLSHELGHYFVARRVGAPVSFPFFIPIPLPPFGTMGAFIQMKAPPKNRRDLLAVGVAGPLTGLIVAIPILLLGLSLSQVQPLPPGGYQMEGNSLLYAALKFLKFGQFLPTGYVQPGTPAFLALIKLIFPPFLLFTNGGILPFPHLIPLPPSGGLDVWLHQVALAGWAGLLVTGLNLIPAGQLDGGHVAYALFGQRTRVLTGAIIVTLAALGFFWNGWWLWAFLVFIFGRFPVPLLDDITALDRPRQALAILLLIIFVLVFVPIPMALF